MDVVRQRPRQACRRPVIVTDPTLGRAVWRRWRRRHERRWRAPEKEEPRRLGPAGLRRFWVRRKPDYAGPACRSTPWPLPAITQLRGVRWDGSSELLCTPTVASWHLRPSVIILLIGLAILVEAEESDGCIEPAKPQKKPYRPQIGGGDGGGKAVGRREDYQRWMPRTQCRTRRETEAANPWICSMGRQSPEPRSRFDLRRGPGAGKPYAGIYAGGRGNLVPYRCRMKP